MAADSVWATRGSRGSYVLEFAANAPISARRDLAFMHWTILLAALLTSSCTRLSPFAPTEGPFRFSGTVSALTGAHSPIRGAELVVIKGVNTNTKVLSDASGRYMFDGLERGRFTISIAAPGFVSVSPVVDLYRDIEVNFALTPR